MHGIFVSIYYKILSPLVTLYIYMVIGRALITWIHVDRSNPIVRFLCKATDPVLYRLRRLLPFDFGGIDLTPAVLILLLIILNNILLMVLSWLDNTFA